MLIIFLQYMTQFLDITKPPCMGLLSFFYTSYTLKLASKIVLSSSPLLLPGKCIDSVLYIMKACQVTQW